MVSDTQIHFCKTDDSQTVEQLLEENEVLRNHALQVEKQLQATSSETLVQNKTSRTALNNPEYVDTLEVKVRVLEKQNYAFRQRILVLRNQLSESQRRHTLYDDIPSRVDSNVRLKRHSTINSKMPKSVGNTPRSVGKNTPRGGKSVENLDKLMKSGKKSKSRTRQISKSHDVGLENIKLYQDFSDQENETINELKLRLESLEATSRSQDIKAGVELANAGTKLQQIKSELDVEKNRGKILEKQLEEILHNNKVIRNDNKSENRNHSENYKNGGDNSNHHDAHISAITQSEIKRLHEQLVILQKE